MFTLYGLCFPLSTLADLFLVSGRFGGGVSISISRTTFTREKKQVGKNEILKKELKERNYPLQLVQKNQVKIVQCQLKSSK